MNIKVWSDFVCPFCYIGKRRLEEALQQFPHREEVQIEFKSFELDPQAPKDTDMTEAEILSKKYGVSVEKAKQMTEQVAQQAEAVGLVFAFETMIPTNTFDAHRLAKLAKVKGKEAEITEKLFYAHFTESKHIGDVETLLHIADAVGLDREEVEHVLHSPDEYASDVREDEKRAHAIGVQGVPFFVVNDKYAISGAQPAESIVKALQQAWEEAHPQELQHLTGEGSACMDGQCDVPEKE
ncbi:DsbA family oxidoreductase [Pontibacillus litoralis]|uniref:DSBA oxidoreductase n=1 Tax=Pontibacillus litoralis JSM 072002 TaxID=1385512 RepID=A0A0A5G6B1_9BACI|nr:DsbA family oxidoreductase [Pontibacillus litoralis]KGX86630.1 DSBA oxidoreductase [Pontibacillus litoralis JSM 072002]